MATTKLIDKYNVELLALSSEKINGNYVILANDDNADNPTNYKIKCNDFKNWINDDISISQKFNDITEQISQLIDNNNALSQRIDTLSKRIDTLEKENEELKTVEKLLSLSSN